MRMQDYIWARDQYIQTEVYAELRDHVKSTGISDEQCDEMIKSASERAGEQWERVVAKEIIKAFNACQLPDL